MPLGPFKKNKNPIEKFSIYLVFPALVMLFYLYIGCLFLSDFLKQDHFPDVGQLPLILDWEIDHKDANINAINPDGTDLFVLSSNSLEKYDRLHKLIWVKAVSKPTKGNGKPVFDDRWIYLDDFYSTIAVDKTNGKTIWSVTHPENIIANSRLLGLSNGMLLVELNNYGLYGLNAKDGKVVWHYPYSHDYANVLFFEKKVIIELTNHFIICDVASGRVEDEIKTNLTFGSALENDSIYFIEEQKSDKYEIKSYNLINRQENTAYITNEEIQCLSVSKDYLYINTKKNVNRIFSLINGVTLWETKSDYGYCDSIFVSNDTVIILDNKGLIRGYRVNDGSDIGSFNNYWINDPRMVSIKTNNTGKFEIVLANSRKIYHFTEIDQ